MMHRKFLVLIALISFPHAHAANVSWIGGSGSWQDAAKWSSGTVPGQADNVLIDVASNITVSYNGTSSVRSVNSKETLQLQGGSLEVRAASTITGPLDVNNAALGAGGGELMASGSTTSTNGVFFANPNGQTRLPGLTMYTANASNQVID
jgi:hypothetical protein